MMSKMKVSLPWILRAGLLAGAIGVAVTATSAMAGKEESGRFEKVSAVLLERGIGLLEKNQIDAARPFWEQAVVANPRNAVAYSYLGLAAQRAGDKEAARKYFNLALEIDPNERHALSWGGQVDLAAADLEGAQAKLQRLSRLCGPGCAEYRLLSDSVVSYKLKISSN